MSFGSHRHSFTSVFGVGAATAWPMGPGDGNSVPAQGLQGWARCGSTAGLWGRAPAPVFVAVSHMDLCLLLLSFFHRCGFAPWVAAPLALPWLRPYAFSSSLTLGLENKRPHLCLSSLYLFMNTSLETYKMWKVGKGSGVTWVSYCSSHHSSCESPFLADLTSTSGLLTRGCREWTFLRAGSPRDNF